MSNDNTPRISDILARQGLRFRILCEHYMMFHKGENPLSPGITPKYKKLGIEQSEVNAAEKYLIDKGLLEGRIYRYSGSLSIVISGVSDSGSDFVEDVVKESESVELDEAVSGKNIEKVEAIITKCFSNPAVGSVYKILADVIVHSFQTL